MSDLTTSEIEIDEDKPWENSLGREKFGKFFCEYLSELQTPSVVEISAGYGEGKTTFIKRCVAHINHKNNPRKEKAEYLNIWEDDYYDNPIVPLLNVLKKEKTIKDIITDKSNLKILKKTLSIGSKVITSGLIDISHVLPDEIQSKAEVVSDLSGAVLDGEEKKIKDFVQEIKKALEKASKNEKLIIFVDELDRCRPDYAIRTLEIIKHLFKAGNIIFVISTDDNRLKSCVESVYGSQTSNEDYLRKFIDVQFNLLETNEIDENKKFIQSKFQLDPHHITLLPSLREAKYIKYSLEKSFDPIINKGDIIRYFTQNNNNNLLIDEARNIATTAFVFMFMLRHMKPELYFKVGSKGIWDANSLSQLKLSINTSNDMFIHNREDFRVFLKCICQPSSEINDYIKQIFNSEEYEVFKHSNTWTLDNLKKYNGSCMKQHKMNGNYWYAPQNKSATTAQGIIPPTETENAKRLCKKVQDNALAIWLWKHIPNNNKSLAQQSFEIIDEEYYNKIKK